MAGLNFFVGKRRCFRIYPGRPHHWLNRSKAEEADRPVFPGEGQIGGVNFASGDLYFAPRVRPSPPVNGDQHWFPDTWT